MCTIKKMQLTTKIIIKILFAKAALMATAVLNTARLDQKTKTI